MQYQHSSIFNRLLLTTLICSQLAWKEITANSKASRFKSHRNSSRFSTLDYLPLAYNGSSLRAHHRIHLGRTAREGEFPSFVSLASYSRNYELLHFCSGVLITELLVLTAGHCFPPDAWPWGLFAAPTIWHPRLWHAKGVRVHPIARSCGRHRIAYSHIDLMPVNDWELFRLSIPIRHTRLAVLPSQPIQLGSRGTVVGIGLKNEPHDEPASLQASQVENVPCEIHPHATRVCFLQSPYTNGVTCAGDSGGPIYTKDRDGNDVVMSITSLSSIGCIGGYTWGTNLYDDMETIVELARNCLSDTH